MEEARERSRWEQIRWLAAVMLAPHTKKGKSIKPRDLVTFPWEKEEYTQQDNDEAAKKRAELFAQWDEEIKAKYG